MRDIISRGLIDWESIEKRRRQQREREREILRVIRSRVLGFAKITRIAL